MEEKNPYLLPDNVAPSHYDIHIQPDLKKFRFKGEEAIAIVVYKPTSEITLHAVELKLLEAEAFGEYASSKAVKITYNEKKQTATLSFPTQLGTDTRMLAIKFEGKINNDRHGFYRTSYKLNGKTVFGAATQFESTDARRCFPCWDEPARKATYSITLTVPEDMTALSNMPIRATTNIKNKTKTVHFDTTPIMSTYLVCFVVVHLKCIKDFDHNEVPIRTWAVPGKEEWGRFALERTKHTLKFYEEKFGISYKSIAPKLDKVACPDFAAGAMENLGAETFRETALLIDPQNTTAATKERVAEVSDHEDAHMWFGDLVTMKWWNSLWLQEGFATFMSHCSMAKQNPEWDIWTRYVITNLVDALHLDGLRNTHPIEIDSKNPAEIEESFDGITYEKGSFVNRMLEQYLGEKYWEGIRLYLKRHAYSNATTEDLWAALEEVSGKPVRDIMAGYTKQPGYPVLTVDAQWTEPATKNPELKLFLKQERFLIDGSKDHGNKTWKVPISIFRKNRLGEHHTATENFLMEKQSCSITIDQYDAWLKLNAGQNGFYRVAYSDGLWKALVEAVKRGELSAADQIGLLDDSMALAKAGYMTVTQALDMIEAHQNDKEFDYNVWSVVITNLNAIEHLLGKENKKDFYDFSLRLLEPVSQKLTWKKLPNEKHTDTLLRGLMLRTMGKYGYEGIIEGAKMRFWTFTEGEKIDPDLKSTVYSLYAGQGDIKAFNELVKLYDATEDAQEKQIILRAMGSFRDTNAIQKVLEFALSEKVRGGDMFIVIGNLGANDDARTPTWEFIKKNWQIFKRRDKKHLPRMLDYVASGFLTDEDIKDVKRFFKTHKLENGKRTTAQIIEKIRANIKWRKRDLKEIKAWLLSRQGLDYC